SNIGVSQPAVNVDQDGRRIEKVDIQPFIRNLPLGQDTGAFCTDNASGSTSQAANIVEALEAGTDVLLIDEDTSATNFLMRDYRMQQLVPKRDEPITPLLDKVRQLYRDAGVSTILVLGGAGDYFEVADEVICLEQYRPLDRTERARQIVQEHPSPRQPEGGETFEPIRRRVPLRDSFDPSKGKRSVKIVPRGLTRIQFGTDDIDLSASEQLVDTSQTRAIGEAIHHAMQYMDGRPLAEVLREVVSDVRERGLDGLTRHPAGDLAQFRPLELAAAINRLRTLQCEQDGPVDWRER
ncbi:MAG: P-loop domain-containing protein, partial [Planctomycetota bacterium]